MVIAYLRAPAEEAVAGMVIKTASPELPAWLAPHTLTGVEKEEPAEVKEKDRLITEYWDQPVPLSFPPKVAAFILALV